MTSDQVHHQLFYKLGPDGKTPIPCTREEYAADEIMFGVRFVGADTLEGSTRVSTLFLAIDHGMGRPGPPILFETRIEGGPLSGESNRYATWDEAERGHAEMFARALAASKDGGSARAS